MTEQSSPLAQTVPQMIRMLGNLDAWLAKAAAHADHKKYDVNNLMTARLAPDMLTFTKQVQIASDTAKASVALLSGKTPPKYEDNEKTWGELRERVQKTAAYLKTFKADDFKNYATVKVAPHWAEGKWVHGEQYLPELALPNFYFHVTICYALLRHAGVEIGKGDFLGPVNWNK